MPLPSTHDPEIERAIQEAAAAACRTLDVVFPGKDDPDAPGITSNFQGKLEEVLIYMLKGFPVIVDAKGHHTHLPKLIKNT